MIKLNWYVLTKPHVVARYYRMKDNIEQRILDITLGSYIHSADIY
jgi:hypothetical protein